MQMHLTGRGNRGAMFRYEYGRYYYFVGDEVEVYRLVLQMSNLARVLRGYGLQYLSWIASLVFVSNQFV